MRLPGHTACSACASAKLIPHSEAAALLSTYMSTVPEGCKIHAWWDQEHYQQGSRAGGLVVEGAHQSLSRGPRLMKGTAQRDVVHLRM